MFAGPGTKPGLRSQTLVSTGQAELDRILGGGVPLGSVLAIFEDAYTQHHQTLLKYFLAEGHACGQEVLWAVGGCTPADDPQKDLPQLVLPSTATSEASVAEEKGDSGLRIAWQYRRYIQDRQNAPAAPPKTGGSAFQRKQPGNALAGSATAGMRDWCHTFDLTRQMQPSSTATGQFERRGFEGESAASQLLEAAQDFKAQLSRGAQRALQSSARQQDRVAQAPNPAAQPQRQNTIADDSPSRPVRRLMSSMSDGRSRAGISDLTSPMCEHSAGDAANLDSLSLHEDKSAGRGVAASAGAQMPPQSFSQTRSNPQQPRVGRLAVQSLGSHHWRFQVGETKAAAELLRLVHRLKGLARASRIAVVLTIPTGLYGEGFAARLAHMCDAVLMLEAVKDTSDILQLVSDPASCCGISRVVKLPASNTLAPPPPDRNPFLIRHKRRRIALEPFTVDPDAEEALTSSAGSASTPSAALMCGGPPHADNRSFDF